MWLIASFDLPAEDRADAKRYRVLRKTMLAAGFSFVQKSVAWRWCADREQSKWMIDRIRKVIPEKGNVLFFQMSEAAFGTTVHIADGAAIDLPTPPDLWLFFS